MNIEKILDNLQPIDHVEKKVRKIISQGEKAHITLVNGYGVGKKIFFSDNIIRLFDCAWDIGLQISEDGQYLILGNPLYEDIDIDCKINEAKFISCTWLVESITDAFNLDFKERMFLTFDDLYVDYYNNKPVVVVNVKAPKGSNRPNIEALCKNAKVFDCHSYSYYDDYAIKIINGENTEKRVVLSPGICEFFSWSDSVGFATDADKKYLVLETEGCADSVRYDITMQQIKCDDLIDDLVETFKLDFSKSNTLVFEGIYAEPWALIFKIRE